MARSMQRVFPTEIRGTVVVLAPEGDALGVQESQLRREISAVHELLEQSKSTALIVDLGRAKYFSSIVIGAVLTMCTKMKQLNRPAVLCNATEAVFDVLQIMKLDTILPYYATREEAFSALTAAKE